MIKAFFGGATLCNTSIDPVPFMILLGSKYAEGTFGSGVIRLSWYLGSLLFGWLRAGESFLFFLKVYCQVIRFNFDLDEFLSREDAVCEK